MRLASQSGALLLAWAGTLAAQTKEPAPPPKVPALQRTVSTSGQFVIYHAESGVRSKLARKAEDLKTEWGRALEIKDEWRWPVILQMVTLRPAGAPRLRSNVYESDDNELKIQVDIYDPTAIQTVDFDMEIFRALFLEYAYRNTPPKAGKAIAATPPWLIEGVFEDMRVRKEGIVAGLYEKLVQDGPPPKLDAFLKEKPDMMDATSRAIYRAKAMTLLHALLQLPGGRAGLAAYMATLNEPNANDAGKLLAKFPGVTENPGELSKLWALALANASASNRAKPMGIAETQQRLAVIFEISAPKDPRKPEAGKWVGPQALPVLARTDSGRFVAGQKAEDLLRLEVRAHPMVRPIVEEYRMIASELAKKPKKNFDKRIQKNMDLQAAIAKLTDEIDDYLNWFEASKLETPSQKFDESFNVEEKSAVMRRNDAITNQLDEAEHNGW